MPAKHIFITGSTGYIGGSILTELLKHPAKYAISALVRKPDQAEVMKKLGVKPILGGLDDDDILFQASKAADAVVNTADADHLRSVQSIVKGIKAKKDPRAVLLHTSGTGVLTFDPVTTVPFDDEDIDRIHAIPLRAPHKDVDTWIFDNTDDITAAIIAPSTINDIGTGPFKKVSQQVINLIKASVKRGQVGYYPGGKEVRWNNVNIHDLVSLYTLVLDGLLAGTIDHGRKGGWYFGINGEHHWYKISELLVPILHKLGLVRSTEIAPFDQATVDKFYLHSLGKDSRGIANRGRRFGWNPKHPNVYETLEKEVRFLKENGELDPTHL